MKWKSKKYKDMTDEELAASIQLNKALAGFKLICCLLLLPFFLWFGILNRVDLAALTFASISFIAAAAIADFPYAQVAEQRIREVVKELKT